MLNRREIINIAAKASILGLATPAILRAQPKRITILMPKNSSSLSYLDEFTSSGGVPIDIKFYEDYNEIYNEITNGKIAYDGLVCVNQQASLLYSERLLRPINYENFSNFKKPKKSLIGQYSPNEVDYIVSLGQLYTGIAYNKDIFRQPPISWSFVIDKIQSGSRVAWASRLQNKVIRLTSLYLGYGANIQNIQNLRIVRDFLRAYKQNIAFVKNADILLKNNQADIIVEDSPFIAPLVAELPRLGSVYPVEGTAIEELCCCIPKNAKNPELVEQLLNFVFKPAIMKLMLEKSYLSSNVAEYLKLTSQNYQRNPILLPNFTAEYNLQSILFVNKEMTQNLNKSYEQIFD